MTDKVCFDIKKFKETITDNLGPLFGKPNIDTANVLETIVKPLVDKLPDVHCTKVTSLYKSWNWHKRFIWQLLNATKIRQYKSAIYHKRFIEYHTALYSALQQTDCDDERYATEEFVHTLCEDYRKTNYRWWYDSYPKGNMIVSMVVKPTCPVEYIVVDLILEK